MGAARSVDTRADILGMGAFMVTVDRSDETCSVFGSIGGAVPGTVLRFVVGADETPMVLTQADIDRDLHDPFATLLLRQGIIPVTADELLAGIDRAIGASDPLGPASQRSFILGEGSQLPVGLANDGSNANLRFLVARGSAPHGPELILSAPHPQQGLVEVMAWDVEAGGFNFYRSGGDGVWVFAGNSRHALAAPTQGKGPFESHPSGNLLMKEFKLPWVHWHSFKADIFDSVFPVGDVRRSHVWFTAKQGAESAERSVLIPTVARWTSARFDRSIAAGGEVTDPSRVIEQIVGTPTVNLTSSTRESSPVAGSTSIDLPPTFFIDADGLALVGLPGPPELEVSRASYEASLDTFDFVLTDGAGFVQKGDTHFAFVVPERAFEDIETERQAIARALVSPRLAAALLMVDFPNPIFSQRRAQLLPLTPPAATITNGSSAFSEQMAQRILEAAQTASSGSPEREFAELWAAGDDWPAVFAGMLNTYYAAVQQQLGTQSGFDAYVRLAEARRNRVRQMPIFESRLLFAQTNIAPEELVMTRDGSVQAGV